MEPKFLQESFTFVWGNLLGFPIFGSIYEQGQISRNGPFRRGRRSVGVIYGGVIRNP